MLQIISVLASKGRYAQSIVIVVAVVFPWFMPGTVNAALYWTPWVSEENGGPSTECRSWNDAAVGFACDGRYCDNVSLLCETFPVGMTVSDTNSYWTSFFSEEGSGVAVFIPDGYWYPYFGDNFEVCSINGKPGLVNGIRCKDRYCDNISLQCAPVNKYKAGKFYPVTKVRDCQWSAWYSEEQRSVDFGYQRYITGVECNGRYCDNKSFYVCSLVDPAP